MSRKEIWEGVATIACIVLWWPVLAGFRPDWYFCVVSIICLAVLGTVFARRFRRLKQVFDEHEKAKDEEDQQKGPYRL
jgi:hypothetical protein